MTYQPKSDFLHTIAARGFVADCTDLEGLDERFRAGRVTGYIGFDLTATSLHIGNLVQIMLLRWMQRTGHRPITLMGGGTTKVGDPSGKDEMRRILTVEQIAANADGIRQVFAKFISYGDGPTDSPLVDNAEWLDRLGYIDFLRDIGKHFTVNRLLAFESVRARLDREQALSFIEFNYMLLQAYDFLELHRRYGCALQMGGSDQWGNIVSGADLIRRVEGAQAFGLTTPLVTRADGRKMGKSADGAVWLNEDMMSSYQFWQWWRNVDDADVGRFLKMFTELPVDECDRLGALEGAEVNEAKVRLAREVTTLLHGAEAAAAAEATARETFERGGAGEDLPTLALTLEDFEFAHGGAAMLSTLRSMPEREQLEFMGVSATDLSNFRIPVVQVLVRSGLAKSGKEAKRLIAEGGARVDDVPVSDAGLVLRADALAKPVKLSAGRKRHAIVRLEP